MLRPMVLLLALIATFAARCVAGFVLFLWIA